MFFYFYPAIKNQKVKNMHQLAQNKVFFSLVSYFIHVQVGDLGLSKVKRRTLISGGVRGTLPWMAPELLNGSSSLVSEKVDVFSFAIVMWELLTGEEPYADMHYGAIIGAPIIIYPE